jgi:aminopeptidase N
VHFDHAELHIAVKPATQSIEASATLTFSALASTDVLLVDLDRNLPVSAISVDGKALAKSAWSNPEGRLRIPLPHAISKGDKVVATIAYGGKPHVAKNAPWDGGFVWSHTADGQPWVASAVQGEGCDLFWPCIDQPQGEPDLVDTSVTVPKALAASIWPSSSIALIGRLRSRSSNNESVADFAVKLSVALASILCRAASTVKCSSA